MNAFEKLTQLQLKVGYEKGTINPIAVLGLAGETGEVLKEVIMQGNGEELYDRTNQVHDRFIHAARDAEYLKKQIRDHDISGDVAVILDESNVEKFDIEVADTLYYLNAIALSRGKTLEDYAEISYQKVSAKTQIRIGGK